MQPFSARVIQPCLLHLAPHDSVKAVVDAMSQAQTSCVLVVEAQQLVGILTEQDIVRAIAKGVNFAAMPIAALMTKQLISCREAEINDICSIAKILREHGIRHLPVVNHQNQPVGIITPESLQAAQPEYLLTCKSVGETMVRLVAQAPSTASLQQVVDLMAEWQASCVVIGGTHPIGIITEQDIVRFQAFNYSLDVQIGQIMPPSFPTAKPQDTLWVAQQIMQQSQVQQLVVTNEAGELCGIITQTDMLQVLDSSELYVIIESLQQALHDKTVALQQEGNERQHLTQTLQKSKTRYCNILNNLPDLVCCFQPDGVITFANRPYWQYFGKPLQEILGTNFQTLFSQSDHRHNLERTTSPILPKREQQLVNTIGEPRWIQWTDYAIYDDANNIVEYQAIGRDITEQKQAEETLRTSEARYRVIVETQTELVTRSKPDTTMIFVNEALCRLYGCERVDILGRPWHDFIHPDDLEAVLQGVAALSPQNPSFKAEQRNYLANGGVCWIEWVNQGIFDDQGKLIEIQASGRDITDHKQTAAALRCSEARNRAILDAIPDLLLRVERDGTCLDCILPTDAENQFKAVQRHIAEILSPESLQLELEAINRALATGELQVFEHRTVKNDKDAYEEVRTIACGENEVLLMVRDVTRRRQSELQFQRLAENVPGAVYRYVLATDGTDHLTYISPRCRELYELEAEEILQDVNLIWSIVHPDDIERIHKSILESAQTLQPWFAELRILPRSGKLKWVRTFARPERQSTGDILWDGLAIDITESKRATEALQASEAKLRSILENTPSLISLIDRQGRTLFINRSLSQCTAESLIGCNITNYLSPEQPDQLKTALTTVFEQGKPTHFEAVGIGETQSTANYEVRIAPIQNSKPIEAAIVITADISVRKQAEMVLQASEARFRAIFEQAAVGIMQTTLTGHFLQINQCFCELLGYSEVELLRYTVWEITYPEERQLVQDCTQQLIEGKITTVSLEKRFICKNGQVRWVHLTGSLVQNELHQEPYFLGVVKDIQEQKQAEANLRAQQIFLREIINMVGSAIFVKDLDHRYIMANQATAKLYGVRVEDLIGKTDRDFNSDAAQVDEFWATNREVITSLQPKVNFYEVIQNFAGESRCYQTTVSPFINPEGQPQGIIGVSVDITELKQTEEALRQAKEAAEAANLAKSQFLANMSHELRTPLNSILGFAQLLNQDACLTSDQRDQLAIILGSGEHLLELINDVLEMSKIDAGRSTLHITSFDLHYLLQNLQRMLQIRATAKQLALIFDCAANVPRYIQTDESKLRQVLLNLLGNAIKFTAKGRVILSIRIEQSESQANEKHGFYHSQKSSEPISDAVLYFTVEDTGPGIAASEMSDLFNPFVQTQVGKQSQEGTGLGLAISLRFVELMGGTIKAKSIQGQGATFEFKIPVRLTQAESKSSCPVGKIIGLVPHQPSYRILVVEDQIINRKLVVSLLTKLGFEVQEAVDGEEALSLWQQWCPHLILMDIRMPRMNGYEAIYQIRQREKLQQQPTAPLSTSARPTVIIALTASAFKEERAQIFAAGCNGFISKPFKADDLLAAIATYLKIEYIYAEPLEADARPFNKPYHSPPIKTPKRPTDITLNFLPLAWKTELYQAAVQLDADRCLELIQNMSPNHPQVMEQLIDLVTEFRFDVLIDLTQTDPMPENSEAS